jgi:hypothetical protein
MTLDEQTVGRLARLGRAVVQDSRAARHRSGTRKAGAPVQCAPTKGGTGGPPVYARVREIEIALAGLEHRQAPIIEQRVRR